MGSVFTTYRPPLNPQRSCYHFCGDFVFIQCECIYLEVGWSECVSVCVWGGEGRGVVLSDSAVCIWVVCVCVTHPAGTMPALALMPRPPPLQHVRAHLSCPDPCLSEPPAPLSGEPIQKEQPPRGSSAEACSLPGHSVTPLHTTLLPLRGIETCPLFPEIYNSAIFRTQGQGSNSEVA